MRYRYSIFNIYLRTSYNYFSDTRFTRELPDPNLSRLANKTFNALSSFIQGEFQSTLNEFTLIEDINTISNRKYGDMLKMSQNLSVPINDLVDKCISLSLFDLKWISKNC